MAQKDALADVEEYLNTTISSPTNGWFEVYRNENPAVDKDLHLGAVEYLPPDRYVSVDELVEMMNGEWFVVYETTTRDTEGSQ